MEMNKMTFEVKMHEINLQNYLVMEHPDFMIFVSNHGLATFEDDGEVFTYYHGIMIVKRYKCD